MKIILRVIDFETTGIPSDDENHSVCEYGFVDIDAETKTVMQEHSGLVQPTTEMSIEARAVHHIDPAEAQEKGAFWHDAANILEREQNGDDTTIIYVAHNADYEKMFFNPDGAKWIDTYKVALRMYPDASKHSNQYLKYYCGIADHPEHHPPHRALPDCRVTTEILLHMSERLKFNDMLQITKEPPYLTRISFGKHAGDRFEDLPRSYLEWLSKQTDMDEGVKSAVARVMS